MSTETQTGGPPAAAVAGDAHWAAKMARLRARKPAERWLDVRLDDASIELVRVAKGVEHSAQVKARALPADLPAQTALEQASSALHAAEQTLAEQTVRMTFRALPREVYEALVNEHPPSEDDQAQGRVYDSATFAPALCSACSVDGMTVPDALELLQTLPQMEAGLLFETAIAVNQAVRMDMGSLPNG